MQQVIPNNLNYNDVKPVGFPSHVRMEKYTPIAFNTSNAGVASSDIVRFNITTNGFWDPYSAYIKIEVDVSGMDGIKSTASACGSQQVDNSASSFISQMIIYKGGTEIERVEEYDTISAILNDMNGDVSNRLSRYSEGMYAQNTPGGHQYINPVHNNGNIQLGFSPLVTGLPNILNTVTNKQYIGLAANDTYINRYEFVLMQQDGKNAVQKVTDSNLFIDNQNYACSPLQFGYIMPFCQSLSAFGNESLLSSNMYNNTTYKGIPFNSVVTDRQTFCIPILSGLLGILMPKDSYRYVPMKALQELIIEFRLNPYAMFTSGYADGASNTHSSTLNALLPLGTSTNPMLSRIWKITKFEINVEVQYFEPQVEDIILAQLKTEKGIVLHSQSWMLGPRYQIAANSTPNGTYQVNLGFESLKNVVWVYMPDEYTKYSFCRKQYRLSANITQMYIKVGSEYFPPLPITGHGGNAAGYVSLYNDYDASNNEFLISLYKAFGKFHDIQSNCIINPVNFAINTRVFDPTSTTALSNGTNYTNFDTAMSAPLFHENRCVGRAIYAMNLETLNQDYSVISGINTLKNTPFDITVKSDNSAAYPRTYTMYVFCQYDMLIQLRSSGVQILGRG